MGAATFSNCQSQKTLGSTQQYNDDSSELLLKNIFVDEVIVKELDILLLLCQIPKKEWWQEEKTGEVEGGEG